MGGTRFCGRFDITWILPCHLRLGVAASLVWVCGFTNRSLFDMSWCFVYELMVG